MMHIAEKQFQTEMFSQKKLTELYEEKLSNNENRIMELQNLTQEFEKKVETFALERNQISLQHEQTIHGLQKTIDEKTSLVESLRLELENVNQTFPVTEQKNSNGVTI